jgi:hypothetical protein
MLQRNAATPERMLREALIHRGACYAPEEPGNFDPGGLRWVDEPAFDLLRIRAFREMNEKEASLLAQEVLERALENYPEGATDYFDGMERAIADGSIEALIIAQGEDNEFYVWDGWHRMAMAHRIRHYTIHAWVGYRA